MPVSVIKQGDTLIALLHADMSDDELVALRQELADRAGKVHATRVVLDATLVDIVDSFAARTLRGLVETLRLRGAKAVVVGIQPDVALSMAQLGIAFDGVDTGLDLDDGLEILATERLDDR